MELVTLEAEDVTDDLNPESRRDIQFFEESQYAYQKEFLSQMLADALEAGRALGGEYFSGPTSRGMGQEEQIAKGADLWLQAQDFLGYDDLITLLQNSNAQAGIDWAWSLQREPTYQKDIASVASYINPFNTAFEQFGGAAWKLINPFDDKTFPVGEAWDQLTSADDRLLGYGQNPYGSRFKRTTGITDWGDALWFAFDLFDIATLGTGGAVVQPLRRKLAEIMIRTDRWDNALGKKILGDDIYNDLLNRMPSMTKDEYIQFEEDLIRAADEFIGEPSRDIVPQEWIEDDYVGFQYSDDGVIVPNIDIGNGIKASYPISKRLSEHNLLNEDLITVAQRAEALDRSFVLIEMPDGTMQPWYRSSSENSGRLEWFPFEGFGRPNQGDWIRKPETHGQRPPGEQEISDALASRFDHLKPIDIGTDYEPLDPSWVNLNEDFGTLNVAEWGVARAEGFSLRANEGRQQVEEMAEMQARTSDELDRLELEMENVRDRPFVGDPIDEPPRDIVPQEDDAFDIDFDIDEAVEAHYDWNEPGNRTGIERLEGETLEQARAREQMPEEQTFSSMDAHRSPAPQEPDFPTGIERLEGETFWGGMTRHMFNVDADNSVIKPSPINDPRIEIEKEARDLANEWMRRPDNPDFDNLGNERSPAERERVIEENRQKEIDFERRSARIGTAPLVKRPANVTPTVDEAHAFIETYMPPEIMVKVFPFGASDDEAVKFGTILYDYLYDVDFNLGRVAGKGFDSNLHSYPPFLTPNSQATDLYIRSQDTYGATLFDEQGVEGASAIKDAIKVTRNGEPLEYSDILELASDMDPETAEFWQVIDDIFFSGETSANALTSPEGFNEWWNAVQEAKMKIELEYPDLGVTIPEEILNTSHERAMNAIAFEAQLGEHVFGDIFVKNGKFYRATSSDIEDRLYRSDAALTRGALDEGAGDILDSVFPPEQSLGEEGTEAIINYEMPNFTNPESPYAIAGDLEVSAIEYESYLAGRRPRSDVEIAQATTRLRIAVDDFDMLMGWSLIAQENMDLQGFLEVIYRLREGTELHAERLSWLEPNSGTWSIGGLSFESMEDEAYGAVRDFVESSVRTHAGTGGWLYREIGEVTPENELTQLHRLHVAVKKEEETLLRGVHEFIEDSWNFVRFVEIPLQNLGIPEKTIAAVGNLIENLSQSQADAIARDGILGVVPTDENMSALKDIFIGIRSMVDDVGEASNRVARFREEWGF
tara:strand:+ start:19382 stop:23050 length:3669 start_codon:yes stop_codon:yes gene_type:complete